MSLLPTPLTEPPLSQTQSLDLPRAILDASEMSSARALMREAHEALNALEEQMTAFGIVQLFADNPKLISFCFDLESCSNDEGGSYYYATAHVNGEDEPAEQDAEEPDEDQLEILREEVSSWLNNQDDDWLDSMEGSTIRRPEAPEQLVEGVMSQCLSKKDFAEWQASALDAVAKAAPRASPKAI